MNRIQKGRYSKLIGPLAGTLAGATSFDQLSKLWIRNNFIPGESLPQDGILRITYIQNTGSAFGLFAHQNIPLISITIIAIVIILLSLRYLPPTLATSISLGLILSGATGNLIDRICLGYVVDFIDIRLWGSLHWYTFNIADTAIVVGTILLFYAIYRSRLLNKTHANGENSSY